MKRIGKVLSNKFLKYILMFFAIILLIILMIFLFKPKTRKIERKSEEIKKSETTKEYFGKITKSNSGYILKNKIKEKSKTGSYLPKDSFVITENESMDISNKNSEILVEPDSKIYISEKGIISIKKGGIKIKGEIRLVASKYFISGNGEVIVKSKDEEFLVSVKKGEATIFVSKEKKINLKEGEGTIITPDEIEEPFRLPETGEIKVRVY